MVDQRARYARCRLAGRCVGWPSATALPRVAQGAHRPLLKWTVMVGGVVNRVGIGGGGGANNDSELLIVAASAFSCNGCGVRVPSTIGLGPFHGPSPGLCGQSKEPAPAH